MTESEKLAVLSSSLNNKIVTTIKKKKPCKMWWQTEHMPKQKNIQVALLAGTGM